MLTVYTLSTCDSCRKATKWLRAQGVTFVEKAIRETPPSVAELRRALASHGGEVRPLFNTAGRDYRDQQLAAKLPALAAADALALLAGNGNLVKRPFVVARTWARAGFSEPDWKAALAAR